MRALPITVLGLLLIAAASRSSLAQSNGDHYRNVADIVRDREAIARDLVQPIARCVRRRDTDHAAFHGCIDWHSAVHGTLGLVIFSRITRERTYDPWLDQQLSEANIVRERALLRTNPAFEMPYGRAWFLR